MSTKINVTWDEFMTFSAEVNNHKITIDANDNVGGRDKGPRPKPLLLVALGGCTGMDVISILKKMRIEPEYFNVEVEADSTEEHPKYYNKIMIKYYFKGKDLPKAKLEKAVNLSQDRYCGVSKMLNEAADISHEIILES